MISELTPMRWPGAWKDPSALELLTGTAINCLIIENNRDTDPIAVQAKKLGLETLPASASPAGVTLLRGEWPGVKLNQSGHLDHASAGPTGVPWVDSNGWKIRLASEFHPGDSIWVDAIPPKSRRPADSYLVAVADAAAHGGRWIVSLDDSLASEIVARNSRALDTWKRISAAVVFFAARKQWSSYPPEAVIGIISDFSGTNEFLSHELLNLVARTNQQYRIILKSRLTPSSFARLKAVTYTDDQPPGAALRDQILEFVQDGGILITGPKWGTLPGAPAREEAHPRYDLRTLGKGRIAIARPDFEDPYLVANDSVILISHRHELLRFWNSGALGSYLVMDKDRRRAVVQMLFYAFLFGDTRTSVRVAGLYRTAKLFTLDRQEPRDIEMITQGDAVELHLPAISGYAALELEV